MVIKRFYLLNAFSEAKSNTLLKDLNKVCVVDKIFLTFKFSSGIVKLNIALNLSIHFLSVKEHLRRSFVDCHEEIRHRAQLNRQCLFLK